MRTTILIAIVCAFAIGQDAAEQPVDLGMVRVAMVVGCVLAHLITTKLLVVAYCEAAVDHPSFHITREQRMEMLLLGVWLALAAVMIGLVDWVTLVRTNWGWGRWILVDDLLIIGPLVLPWLVSWGILFDMIEPAPPAAAGSALRSRQDREIARRRFVTNHVHFTFGIGLLPLLVVCGVSDVVQTLAPDWLLGRLGFSVYALPLLALLVGYPWLLRVLWQMQPLPSGPTRRRLLEFANHQHIRLRNILLWDTHGQIANAAVTGIVPGWQSVFLTDTLLQQLDRDDLTAVFAHELGHASHRHVVKRILALLLPVSAGIVLATLVPWLVPSMASGLNEPPALGWHSGLGLAGIALVLVYARFGLGWYSRQLEHQADDWACQRLGGAYSQVRYVAVLRQLTEGLPQGGEGWLHPGWASRERHLGQVFTDDDYARAFHRRLAMIGWGLVALNVSAVACLFLA